MIKAVVFDMFETLVTLFEGRTYFSEDIAADINIPAEAFRNAWHATEHDRSIGKLTIEEGLFIALNNLGVYSEDKVDLITTKRKEALNDTFSNIPDNSIQLLYTLHDSHIKTGLITNTFSDERDFIRNSPLFPLLDVSLISYEQGVCKPDLSLYHSMAELLCVKPYECLYVGDGGSRELFAAKEIGMNVVQAAWFSDRAFEPHIPCPILKEFTQAWNQMDIMKLIRNINLSQVVQFLL